MTNFETIGWLLAWSMLPLAIVQYQIKDVRNFLGFKAILSSCMVIIYASQGGNTGAIISIITAVTLAAQYTFGHRISLPYRMLVALPAIILAILWREAGAAAFIPLMAFVFARVAEAIRHDLGLRVTLLLCAGLWMIYGLTLELPQIVLFESIALAANVIAIWRLHFKNMVILISVCIISLMGADSPNFTLAYMSLLIGPLVVLMVIIPLTHQSLHFVV